MADLLLFFHHLHSLGRGDEGNRPPCCCCHYYFFSSYHCYTEELLIAISPSLPPPAAPIASESSVIAACRRATSNRPPTQGFTHAPSSAGIACTPASPSSSSTCRTSTFPSTDNGRSNEWTTGREDGRLVVHDATPAVPIVGQPPTSRHIVMLLNHNHPPQ